MSTQQMQGAKLQQLRARTDRQLQLLISKRLHRASEARHCGTGHNVDVEQICAEIERLLPVARTLTRAERERIEEQLAELRGRLALPAA